MATFKGYERNITYLLPPSMNDWLPKNHLSHFVVDIVEKLDLTEIKKHYCFNGQPAYSPELLIGLLFYGYMTGVFSSRKIEAATYESLAFRIIAANQHPDHDTIATFRTRFFDQLKGFFLQILVIAREMGVKQVGTVSLDGTKIKANASKHKAMSWAYAIKLEEQLKSDIADLIKQGEVADNTPLDQGMSIPEEITIRTNRLKAIEMAKEKIKTRAAERFERESAEYDEKVKKREEKEKETGKRLKGKPPVAPVPGPKDTDQINFTDEESRIMKVSDGGFEQCYNAQACVDTESMLIMAAHLTTHTNDKQEIKPALENLEKLSSVVAEVENLLADTGYHSEQNVKACISKKINPLIAQRREKHHPSPQDRFAEPEPLAEEATDVMRAAHLLKTQAGKKLYAKRKSTVEPVFGIIKHIMGFRQFSLRGEKKAKGEWNLISIAWNIKRLHKITEVMA